ncbi:hypothetical protein K458DRAFT_429915 [Lentithecium fluviatile CBS 122367]|uniref:Zn(2)-C6 fungal-type domain-containing protein n=1 Tax=Lentithecium fluviatile CBS 122367 TaxID=1168545 RepID=A0A6G1J618_9PLEO|nr:hypothetical protein K458DRAFT_429915 [Lentithecium fluviatile CBS 122367]
MPALELIRLAQHSKGSHHTGALWITTSSTSALLYTSPRTAGPPPQEHNTARTMDHGCSATPSAIAPPYITRLAHPPDRCGTDAAQEEKNYGGMQTLQNAQDKGRSPRRSLSNFALTRTRCNSERPSCSECTKRTTECRYGEIESRQVKQKYVKAPHPSVGIRAAIRYAKTIPERDAVSVLGRIRTGADAETLLNQINDGNLLM